VHAVPTTAYGTVRARLEQFGLRRGDRMYVLSAFVPPCARADGGALPDDDCRRLRHEELYDAAADPAGTHDLSAAHAAELAWFREHIAAFGANPVRPDGNRIELSPGDKEKLRALGYNS